MHRTIVFENALHYTLPPTYECVCVRERASYVCLHWKHEAIITLLGPTLEQLLILLCYTPKPTLYIKLTSDHQIHRSDFILNFVARIK